MATLCIVIASLAGCASDRVAPIEEIKRAHSAPIGQVPAGSGAAASSQPGAAAPGAAAPAPSAEAGVEVNAAASVPPIEAHPLGGTVETGPTGIAATPLAPVESSNGPVRTEPRVFKLPYSEQNLATIQNGNAPPAALPPETKPEEAKPSETPAKEAAPEAANATKLQPSPQDHPQFIWPVSGRVIEKFEGKNKGIDIAAEEGDPVQAVAAGNVLYAGSGIRGYGQLLIIKHNDDFLSVYAHNNKLLVKQGQTVKQGQKVAEVGHTDADRPELHFEIRRQGTSVDPLQYLPPR